MFSGIENYYERLVFERIGEVLTDSAGEDHRQDVACIALNRLPPRYIRYPVDLASHLSIKEREVVDKEVDEAVQYAIKLTSERRDDRSE